MKRTIRFGVFETNSSSVHSLTIVDAETYEKFKNGELLMDWDNNFVEPTDENLESDDVKSYEEYGDDYEWFEKEFITKNGDKVVAFGYYG